MSQSNRYFVMQSQTDYMKMTEFVEESYSEWFNKDFLIKVALYEALNNAVEHGEFPVTVFDESDDETFKVTIKDSGAGFSYTPIDEENLTSPDLIRDRGRGLYIIHNVIDIVVFNETGNEIRLIKRFN